jgi:hypothetical protein
MVVSRRSPAHAGFAPFRFAMFGFPLLALSLLAAALALTVLPPVATGQSGVPKLVVASAATNASWRQGWLKRGATVSFRGRVAAASTLTAVLRPIARPGIVTAKADFEVTRGGAFTKRVRLPPRPLPGRYRLRISGASGTTDLKPVELTVTIPTPPEGVLDRAQVSITPNGPWLLYESNSPPVIHGSHKELWMRFRFLSAPTGKHIEIVWKMKWHTVVGKVAKRYKDTLDTFCKSGSPLPSGHWNVVLKIDGRVAKQMDVLIR